MRDSLMANSADRGPWVLVVKGDALAGARLADDLARAGFVTRSVANALQALDALEGGVHEPLAIVTDLVLPPQLDGIELSHRVRELGLGTAVVLLNGTFPEDLVLRAASSGVDHMVRRPAGQDELVGALRRILERVLVEQEAQE